MTAAFLYNRFMQKVLVIAGPTAIGKTSFGIQCAELFNGEIISGDSVQVYRGLDIGSAKATPEERARVPHHLIDIREPNEPYSVRDFQEEARKCIEEIGERGGLPVIVGGTGLYIKACLFDYVFPDEDSEDDPFDELTNEELYAILSEEDPCSAQKIHPNNRKRLVRAVNVLLKHNTSLTDIRSAQEHKCLYDALIIGLTGDRKELYKRIEERVDAMLEEGLLEEIDSLLKKGVSFNDRSMSGIGYKEFRGYFEGTGTLAECREEVLRNTRHFVKRQYTWFLHQLDVKWFTDRKEALEAVKAWAYDCPDVKGV